MSQQFTSSVPYLSFRKKPRHGQKRVFDEILTNENRKALNIQLPTGYGKSFVNAGVYSILKKQNRVNRLLVIVPTLAQRKQLESDGPCDFQDALVDGPLKVVDIGFFGVEALRKHRNNSAQIFTITSQALSQSCKDLIIEMMSTGSWMVTADEYHHYGIEKSWGASVVGLPYTFMLAMSATPYRKEDDSAFGAPNIVVSYRDAVEEKAVKELCSHSYVYRLDVVDENGDIIPMLTTDLIKAAGSCSPNVIEKFKIERKMRWSPKYVSPLVSYPIERMLRERINTGYKLQVIIGAMCVSHAELVCSQIKSMYPELSIDWVGTGDYGRTDEENKRIIERFCPKKDEHGKRKPTLDVLVHVGMAGEGLDSVLVSEVVHLNKASLNNSNNQENGRAARYLPGVIGNINFDSCSEYSTKGYIGHKIMDAMDFMPPKENEDEDANERINSEQDKTLPDEPAIQIWNMELEHIDSGSPEVTRMAQVLATKILPQKFGIYNFESQIGDPTSQLHAWALSEYKMMREKECEEFNEKAVVEQWRDQVNNSCSVIVGRVAKMMSGMGMRFEKSLLGDIKKRINTQKKQTIGEIKNDIECLRQHYKWLKQLETNLIETKSIPQWLL